MSFAILRFSKLKSFSIVSQATAHNNRTRETLNADIDRRSLNEVLVGSGDGERDVRARLESAGIQKLRKNGVLAVEAVLSASPTYFTSEEALQLWKESSLAWLKREFGPNLTSCWLHMDETTPHLHALIVPVDDLGKKPRLNAAGRFSGRPALSKFQSSYAASIAHLGVKRGIPKYSTGASHKAVKSFYNEANAFESGIKAFEDGRIIDAFELHTKSAVENEDVVDGGKALRLSPRLTQPEKSALAVQIQPAFERVWHYCKAQLDALREAARLVDVLKRARREALALELDSAVKARLLERARRGFTK